tara:strand:+ start:532 stop:1140 length:609 start_codon:yes stop_codon:yes gene_type:complete
MTEQLEEVELESEEIEIPTEPSAAKSYICMWDDALPPDYCEETIDLFKESIPRRVDEENYGCFELDILDENLLKIKPRWKEVSYFVLQRLQRYSEIYRQFYNIEFFPSQAVNEQLMMRKYIPTDEVGYHSDVMIDDEHKRFLTVNFFLNDTEDGQYTLPDYNIGVESRTGRVLIHPSFWTHPSQITPSKEERYVISTFLRYQ